MHAVPDQNGQRKLAIQEAQKNPRTSRGLGSRKLSGRAVRGLSQQPSQIKGKREQEYFH